MRSAREGFNRKRSKTTTLERRIKERASYEEDGDLLNLYKQTVEN